MTGDLIYREYRYALREHSQAKRKTREGNKKGRKEHMKKEKKRKFVSLSDLGEKQRKN